MAITLIGFQQLIIITAVNRRFSVGDKMRLMKSLDEDIGLEVRYENAIKNLLDLALDNSDERARIVADILMSASNADRTPTNKWTVNLSEFTKLSEDDACAAMGVLHGRTTLRRNPQTMIPNGAELFRKVWHRWHNVEDW